MTNELFTPKELAALLKRHPSYVYKMVQRGFIMPGGRASVEEARRWLVTNSAPNSLKWKTMDN